jgi:hypothetical protein
MDDGNEAREPQDAPMPARWPVALLAAAACAAAALTWFPPRADPDLAGPRSAQTTVPGSPVKPAIATHAAAATLRPVYRYSVFPGGVASRADVARALRGDRVVAAHYGAFDVAHARVVPATARAVHVSYRKDGKIYWTARKVMLDEGEALLTDGHNLIRARCGNRISDAPQWPVEAGAPDERELDATETGNGDHLLTMAGGASAASGAAPGAAARNAQKERATAPGGEAHAAAATSATRPAA